MTCKPSGERRIAMKSDYTLQRFIDAQSGSYETALSEIRRGRKRSHWMWYIFPQADGLGFSYMASYYGIKSCKEAEAYLNHPILGARLIEISEALLVLNFNDASAIFGYPDDMKLRSSMTLFAEMADDCIVFEQVLDKYFQGRRDEKTIRIIKAWKK